MSLKEFFTIDFLSFLILSLFLILAFTHLVALDNRVTELERIHSNNYCTECGKLK